MLSAKEAKEIADISDMAYPDYYGDIHTVLELIKECAEKGHVRIGFQKLGYLATLHLIGLGYEVEVVRNLKFVSWQNPNEVETLSKPLPVV